MVRLVVRIWKLNEQTKNINNRNSLSFTTLPPAMDWTIYFYRNDWTDTRRHFIF